MSEVTVSDLQAPDGTFQVVAMLPATNYESICKTLNCNEGEVGARLLQRILVETEHREYAEALKYLGMVRGASKLAEFNALFGPGGKFEDMTVQPVRVVVEEPPVV